MRVTFACLAALISFSAQASNINSAYRISGNPMVAPVQAFDNGKQLFFQLRDTNRLPVPLSPEGQPLEYTVRPPYLVLSITPRVMLRYGAAEAWIEAKGATGEKMQPPVGENYWFGGANPAAVTGAAKNPIPAPSVEARIQAKTPPSVVKESKKDFEVSVVRKSATSSETRQPETTLIAVASGIPSDLSSLTANLTTQSRLISDGTLVGYRLARKIASAVEQMRGVKVGIEKTGAPPGALIIEGSSR